MKSNTFLIGGQEVQQFGHPLKVAIKTRPAEESDTEVRRQLERMSTTKFALGAFQLDILLELIEDLAIGEPVEIGLSLGSAAGRARCLFIHQGITKIYLAGMEFIPSEGENPEPDALEILQKDFELLQKENSALKARLATPDASPSKPEEARPCQ